ncbi:MAG TPA: NAD(P)H-dependent oxidoreductase subunit E [Tepidisphaeraceae bacterium]|jgi:NADH-quinone oxidoreductase subunit E
MAWITENRRSATPERREEPYLDEELKAELSTKYFPRYPNKRAVLLPALHAVQHKYNWIPAQAMEEIGTFLGLAPAEVLDTASFYEEYWLKPKGQFLIQVCRSLSCEICGSNELTSFCKNKMGLELGETTDDGRFTLVELECLGACGTAPVALVNDVLHEELTVEKLQKIIDELPKEASAYKDEFVTWNEGHGH